MSELLMRPGHAVCGVGLMLASLLTGCASGPHSSPNAPKVSLVPDNRVILEPAVVTVDDGLIEISGGLHRQPTLSGPMSGRIDIEFVSPEGQVLDEITALLTPHDLTSSHSSTYRTAPYGYIPPKGSTLRIHFVDSDTESREDIAGEFSDYGGGGGGEVGGVIHGAEGTADRQHAASNNHYASHGGGGFGGGFGNNNFSPNGGRH